MLILQITMYLDPLMGPPFLSTLFRLGDFVHFFGQMSSHLGIRSGLKHEV